MTDSRPRPQYGEYAPEGWVSPHLAAPEAPPIAADVVVVDAPKRRTWDTVLTFALLGIGLYSVLSGYVGFSRLPEIFDQMFAQVGIGDFSSDAAAEQVGIIANVTQTVLWVAAAVGAGVWLQRHKIGFWWPLAAGILANLVVVVMVGVVMATDPAYTAYIAGMAG